MQIETTDGLISSSIFFQNSLNVAKLYEYTEVFRIDTRL